MKLYASPLACSMAPHLVLIELGLPYTLELVDIHARPQVLRSNGAPYAAINPKGAVPALLLDSGGLLTENPVVLQYLADLKPELGLLPSVGSMARYRALEWLSCIGSDLHKTLGQLWNRQMPEEAKALLRQNLQRRLSHIEQHLDGRPHLMGEAFGVADAYLWVLIGWLPLLKVGSSVYPNLERHHARVGQRPSARQVLEQEGLVQH